MIRLSRGSIFNSKSGQDLPQWMTNELMLAEKILLICGLYAIVTIPKRQIPGQAVLAGKP